MHCSPKAMIKTGAVLGGVLLVAYFAFPQAQALVLASAPILLALICPVTMIVMMFMMRSGQNKPSGSAAAESAAAAPTATPYAARDASVERA